MHDRRKLRSVRGTALLLALEIFFWAAGGCAEPPRSHGSGHIPGRASGLSAAAAALPPAPLIEAWPPPHLGPGVRDDDPPRSAWFLRDAPPPRFDRGLAADGTLGLLSELIALDTQNPPGNERVVAERLAESLRDLPGVEVTVLDAGEGRANLVARLRAERATARPVLILGHMDTVNAQPERWDTPPLVPTLRDGYLYGRGAIDDKGMLAAATVALRQLAERRGELTRDVILLATAAEEGGPPVGVDLVLERHRELLGDAAFALNEGGRIRLVDGVIAAVNVQTTEKLAYNVLVTAEGPSGHGSVPMPGNALAALARAVARVDAWRAPVRLNDSSRGFLTGLARLERDPRRRQDFAELLADETPGAQAAVRERALAAGQRLAEDPLLNALLRTGQSLTLIDGGIRSNVIPSTGTASFNVRTLPDDDITEIVAAMQAVGGGPAVRFLLDGAPKTSPPASGTDTALYRAFERATQAMAPQALVMPYMSTGATDGAALRAAGIPTYGILPFPLALEDELRMHGDNERVPVEALAWGTEFLYRVLWEVAGTP